MQSKVVGEGYPHRNQQSPWKEVIQVQRDDVIWMCESLRATFIQDHDRVYL